MAERVWTISVCPVHGPVEPGSMRHDLKAQCTAGGILEPYCKRPLERIEVVPEARATQLEEALREEVARLTQRAYFERSVQAAERGPTLRYWEAKYRAAECETSARILSGLLSTGPSAQSTDAERRGER